MGARGLGILIAVEGIDGTGKSTQVQLLGEALKAVGEQVVTSKEPTDGVWGRKIRKSANRCRMSLEDELHAFVEDRTEHVRDTISPSLAEGKIVILDRYFYSTIAYQGSRGADIGQLTQRMQAFPIPHAVLLIDLDPNMALQRISTIRGETPNAFEKLESLTEVRKVFTQLWQSDQNDIIQRIDGNQSIRAIHHQIVSLLIAGTLKKKRCRKQEGCGTFWCFSRMTNTCNWFKIQKSLKVHARR